MMYNQKLVASLKANGKVLREFKDTVFIPFGAEYSVLLKNLHSVRCIVNVFIDGDNVVPGGLVLAAGQECNLERSIKNGNLQEGNKFKFIERTGSIEEHRGIKLEDGLIRIEYQFEKVYQRQDGIQWNNNWHNNPTTFGNMPSGSILRGMTNIAGSASDYTDKMIFSSTNAVNCSATYDSNQSATATLGNITAQSFNDVGITVPGSKSEQKFNTATWFATEVEKHTIVLKILGETADNKPVVKPVTVKAKPKCQTCGKINKATAKFCSECGTALEIF
jgi:hypothetical protein